MKRRFRFSLGILMLMGVLFTSRADAGLILRVTAFDPSNVPLGPSLTISDNGLGDSDPQLGSIIHVNLGWQGWTLNVNTGVGDPILAATDSGALMHLTVSATSLTAGRLFVEFSQSGTPELYEDGLLIGQIGGVTTGVVTANGVVHTNVDPFDPTSPLGVVNFGPFSGGAYSGTASDLFPQNGNYNMLQTTSITHGNGANSTSVDYFLITTVPVPAGFVMFAIGGVLMAGGEVLRRRRLTVA